MAFGDEEALPKTRIYGYIFEDVNYGGGHGTDYEDGVDSPCQNATMEFYDVTSGQYLGNTTTDNNGEYSFNVTSNTSCRVRVVSNTVSSYRGDGSELEYLNQSQCLGDCKLSYRKRNRCQFRF